MISFSIMESILFIFICCFVCSIDVAFATDLLPPGIYRLDVETNSVVQQGASSLNRHDTNIDRLEHAIPEAAKVNYAIVSRNEKSNLNKVVFLTDKKYQYDVNSANKLCVAYAFPHWNYHSDSEPYCRTGIGDPVFEAVLSAEKNSFSVSWQANRKLDRQELIPPIRPPGSKEVGACAFGGTCSEEAYGYVINHYVTTHYNDIFSLHIARPYLDILYLNKEVPFYTRSSTDSLQVMPNDVKFVAVTAIYPEWYEIEWVGQDGQASHGWLYRDDLIEGEWVEQEAKSKIHFFRVAVEAVEQDGIEKNIHVIAIEVLDRKTRKRVQVIYDFESDLQNELPEELIRLVDANFDGYPDISIFGQSGGAGPNSTDNFFLFNPKTQQFEFNEMLSNLPQITINPATKTIDSAQRGSCCDHSSETYRYIAGKLTLVANWHEQLSADGKWLETTTGKLQGGKMLYRVKRKKASVDQ